MSIREKCFVTFLLEVFVFLVFVPHFPLDAAQAWSLVYGMLGFGLGAFIWSNWTRR